MNPQEEGWRAEFPITRDLDRRRSVGSEPQKAVDVLRAKGVITDTRPGLIRLSPHYFNTADEMSHALELLAPLRAVAASA